MFTPRSPIGSGFGASSTAEEVIHGIDLTGKCAAVTGGWEATDAVDILVNNARWHGWRLLRGLRHFPRPAER